MAKAILWDMDGTLVDSEPLHEAALVAALAEHGLEPPAQFHDLIVGHDAASIHAWCVEHLGLALDLRAWLELKYRNYFMKLDLLPERERAVGLFRELEAAGCEQAVVSNSDRIIVQGNLGAVGLSVPGRVSVSRNDVRDGKPAPECYLRAAWLLAADPAECIVVEDSPTGAQAGVAAGMRTLFWPQAEAATPHGAERIADMAALETALTDGEGR